MSQIVHRDHIAYKMESTKYGTLQHQVTASFLLLLVPIAGIEGEAASMLLVLVARLPMACELALFFCRCFFSAGALSSSVGFKMVIGTSSSWLEPILELLVGEKNLESELAIIVGVRISHTYLTDTADGRELVVLDVLFFFLLLTVVDVVPVEDNCGKTIPGLVTGPMLVSVAAGATFFLRGPLKEAS